MTTSSAQKSWSATWLGALEWTTPFVTPLIAALATAIYSGTLGAGLPTWAKGLLIGMGPLTLHVVLPLLDWVVGPQCPPPLPPGAKPPPSDDLRSRLLPTLTLLTQLSVALYAYATIATQPPTAHSSGLLVLLALTLATSASTAMAAAHETVHSRHPLHLGATVAYLTAHWWFPYYRVHHQHHLHVGTPADYTCGAKGSNTFVFFGQYVVGSYAEAWQLAAAKCRSDGQSPFSLMHNRTLLAYVAQLLITAAIWLVFGPVATAVHLACCAFVVLYISLIDYVLHYGLYRPPLPGNTRRFSPVTPYTSWNSLYPFENALLFQVLCHSDHHLQGNKSYSYLRPPASLPTFPAPLNLLGLATLVPPLWRAIMDERVDLANARNLEHLGYTAAVPVAAAAGTTAVAAAAAAPPDGPAAAAAAAVDKAAAAAADAALAAA